jgi:ubiquinone/menaquinone biosynthesis C-methylase UbiE
MFFPLKDARQFRDHIAARLLRASAALLVDGMPGLFSGIEILEVGAGTGLLAEHLTPSVNRFSGTLHATDRGRHLLRYTPAGNARVVADPSQLPYPNDRFDLIIGNAALGGRTDGLEELVELRRVIRPTGILHMSGFLPSSFEALFDLLVEACEEKELYGMRGRLLDGRTEFLKQPEMESMMVNSGFNIGHLSIEDRAIMFKNGQEVMDDLLVQFILAQVLGHREEDATEFAIADVRDAMVRNIDMYFAAGSFPLKISTVVVTAGCGDIPL